MNRIAFSEKHVSSLKTQGHLHDPKLKTSSFVKDPLVPTAGGHLGHTLKPPSRGIFGRYEAEGRRGLQEKKDISFQFQGYKYPDRVYGHKFNDEYKKGPQHYPVANKMEPKSVNKPIAFSNLQSLSYFNPTIVTRSYQREMPPNLLQSSTAKIQMDHETTPRQIELRQTKGDKKTTTYAQSFYRPDDKLQPDLEQTAGMKGIVTDLKTLGFKRKPHQNTCRQKSYELSKTACFHSSFNGNKQLDFFTSFDNGYSKHKSQLSVLQRGDATPKSNLQISSAALQAMADRKKFTSTVIEVKGGAGGPSGYQSLKSQAVSQIGVRRSQVDQDMKQAKHQTLRDDPSSKSQVRNRPHLATTVMNTPAPQKFNNGPVKQPHVEGLKKFYYDGGDVFQKRQRKLSASKKISLSHTGMNEQSYSQMTRFKHDLDRNKIFLK